MVQNDPLCHYTCCTSLLGNTIFVFCMSTAIVFIVVSNFALVEFKHVQVAWKNELNSAYSSYSDDFMLYICNTLILLILFYMVHSSTSVNLQVQIMIELVQQITATIIRTSIFYITFMSSVNQINFRNMYTSMI